MPESYVKVVEPPKVSYRYYEVTVKTRQKFRADMTEESILEKIKEDMLSEFDCHDWQYIPLEGLLLDHIDLISIRQSEYENACPKEDVTSD